ncbi:PucR family transcriptional regulator [Gordonia iterans]
MTTGGGVPLSDLVAALDSGVDDVALSGDPLIASVAMADCDDVAAGVGLPDVDLLLLVGVDDGVFARRPRPDDHGPRAVVTRSAALARAAADAGLGAISIASGIRWDRVLAVVQDRLDRAREKWAAGASSADLDLTGLVSVIAEGTGGLVSIEDPTSARVLAYSPSRGEADPLRVQTILGRGGPPEYLDRLRRWGVFEAIARGGEVVDVPDHPEHAWRRRLVIGVHGPGGRHLGSIWVQEGDGPLRPDAADTLRGAAVVAARILTRTLEAPSTEAQLLQRVFGEHGGIDQASAGAYLGISPVAETALVGLAVDGAAGRERDALAALGGAIRLQASAFAASAVTAVIGARAYLLIPETDSGRLAAWVHSLVGRFDESPAALAGRLRAAIVSPVDGLEAVPAARAECDRVLAATSGAAPRVTTLAQSRTAVLLREMLDRLSGVPELVDPRLTRLRAYDEQHRSDLAGSLRAWIDAHGNVRDAAGALGVHTNTLRYRIERAQAVSGLQLDDPDDRLLLALTLRLDR